MELGVFGVFVILFVRHFHVTATTSGETIHIFTAAVGKHIRVASPRPAPPAVYLAGIYLEDEEAVAPSPSVSAAPTSSRRKRCSRCWLSSPRLESKTPPELQLEVSDYVFFSLRQGELRQRLSLQLLWTLFPRVLFL